MKRFERSNGLDTALYKTILLAFNEMTVIKYPKCVTKLPNVVKLIYYCTRRPIESFTK